MKYVVCFLSTQQSRARYKKRHITVNLICFTEEETNELSISISFWVYSFYPLFLFCWSQSFYLSLFLLLFLFALLFSLSLLLPVFLTPAKLCFNNPMGVCMCVCMYVCVFMHVTDPPTPRPPSAFLTSLLSNYCIFHSFDFVLCQAYLLVTRWLVKYVPRNILHANDFKNIAQLNFRVNISIMTN